MRLEEKTTIIEKLLSDVTQEEKEELMHLLKKQGINFNLFNNPTPVAVSLVPVETKNGIRLLTVVRNIPPQIGGIALPGGYVDPFESFEMAAARETKEETGLCLPHENFSVMLSHTTQQNNILVFCRYTHLVAEQEIDQNFSNNETQRIILSESSQEYCFPSHSKVASLFWNNFVN